MTDRPRLPVYHPANAADAAARADQLVKIGDGLREPNDASYWRDLAQRRVDALDADRAVFGLVAHEVVELAQLKRLLAGR